MEKLIYSLALFFKNTDFICFTYEYHVSKRVHDCAIFS